MKAWWKWDQEEDWEGHLYLSTKQKPFPAGADWYISHAIICYLILTDRSGGWAVGVQRGAQFPSWPGQTPPPTEEDMVDPASQWKIRPTTARQGPTGGRGQRQGDAGSLGTHRVINCEWFIRVSQQRAAAETFLNELRRWEGIIHTMTHGHNLTGNITHTHLVHLLTYCTGEKNANTILTFAVHIWCIESSREVVN